MAVAEESNLETNCCEASLPSRLLTLDFRLDDLHAQAAASGTATMEFAEAAIQRIAGLEAEVLQLSCGSQLHRQHLFGPQPRVDDESCTETWILQKAHREALQSIETAVSRIASVERRCAAAEREAHEAVDAAQGAAQMLTQLEARVWATESRVCQLEANSELKSCDGAGGDMRDLQICADAKTVAVVEERVREGVSQCVGLVDAVRGLAGLGGLDALRDLVEAVESVASRVTTLERLTDGHACHTQPAHGVSNDLLERINIIERHMAEIHDQLSESLLTLWAAVREISRELSGAGGDSGIRVGIDRPETPQQQQQQQQRWCGQSQVTPPLLPSFAPAHMSQKGVGDSHACQL